MSDSDFENNGTVNEIPAQPIQSSSAPAQIPNQPDTNQPNAQGQPATPNINIYYDSEGRPIIRATASNQGKYVPEKKPRVGHFIASIITLIIAIGSTAFSLYYFFSTWIPAQGTNGALSALTFFIYIFSGIGILIALPGLGFSTAALICSCIAVKSSKTAIKIISGFIIALTVITILVGIFLPFLLLVASNGSSGS